MCPTFILVLHSDLLRDPSFFVWGKEFGFRRTAWQQEIGQHTADHGRNTLQNEKPPPTSKSERVHVVQNQAGERRSQNVRHRYSRDKKRNRLSLLALPKPISKVKKNRIPYRCCEVATRRLHVACEHKRSGVQRRAREDPTV